MNQKTHKAVTIFSKRTKIDAFKDFSDIAGHITRPSFTVLYLDNGILIGRYSIGSNTASSFQFDEEQLKDLNITPGQLPEIDSIQRLRIFNENEEFLIWRSVRCGEVTHSGRFRSDSDSDDGREEIRVIYSDQVLFGTHVVKRSNGFITIKEDRGIKIILPDSDKNGGFKVDSHKNRIAIRTCNYAGFGGLYKCQATYIDSRFVDFVQLSQE